MIFAVFGWCGTTDSKAFFSVFSVLLLSADIARMVSTAAKIIKVDFAQYTVCRRKKNYGAPTHMSIHL